MQEFTALRTRARQYRDQTIARAQADYEQRLIVINKLERELTGAVTKRYRKLTACVEQGNQACVWPIHEVVEKPVAWKPALLAECQQFLAATNVSPFDSIRPTTARGLT